MNKQKLRRIVLEEMTSSNRRSRKVSLTDYLGESSGQQLLSLDDGVLVSSGISIDDLLEALKPGGGEYSKDVVDRAKAAQKVLPPDTVLPPGGSPSDDATSPPGDFLDAAERESPPPADPEPTDEPAVSTSEPTDDPPPQPPSPVTTPPAGPTDDSSRGGILRNALSAIVTGAEAEDRARSTATPPGPVTPGPVTPGPVTPGPAVTDDGPDGDKEPPADPPRPTEGEKEDRADADGDSDGDPETSGSELADEIDRQIEAFEKQMSAGAAPAAFEDAPVSEGTYWRRGLVDLLYSR